MKSELSKLFINRILTSILVLFLLITLVFLLIRLAPGNPVQKFISPKLSPELITHIEKSFNLDQPIHIQYFSFLTKIFTGDFGISYTYRTSVLTVIKNYFLFTLIFSSISFFLQFLIAFLIARFTFKYKDRFIDRITNRFAVIIYTIPSFVLGLFLIIIFSVSLNLFPTSGIESIHNDSASILQKMSDHLYHLILPLITLTAAGSALFYRYLRDGFTQIAKMNFVTNLRASGFSEKEIFNRHILPNAIQPLISAAGIEFGILMGGALITEVIFSLPGMGRLTVSAIINHDYPLVIGCTFIAGMIMILTNLIADLVKVKFDKRLIKELIE
ncbi:MAG: ABC transporter permease [Ignavibacterium sp.]|jgi:peptide/nickel transport system permease protein|nr:ABC transporter permease [Ignavibacterium sp.]